MMVYLLMGYGYGMVLSYRILSYLVSSVCTHTLYLPYRRTTCFTQGRGRAKAKKTDIRKQKTENSTKYPDRFGIMLLTDLFTVLTSSWHRPGTILCTLSFSISIHSSQFCNNLIFCKQNDDEICRQGPY